MICPASIQAWGRVTIGVQCAPLPLSAHLGPHLGSLHMEVPKRLLEQPVVQQRAVLESFPQQKVSGVHIKGACSLSRQQVEPADKHTPPQHFESAVQHTLCPQQRSSAMQVIVPHTLSFVVLNPVSSNEPQETGRGRGRTRASAATTNKAKSGQMYLPRARGATTS